MMYWPAFRCHPEDPIKILLATVERREQRATKERPEQKTRAGNVKMHNKELALGKLMQFVLFEFHVPSLVDLIGVSVEKWQTR
jgi:hypothetical protein